MCMIQCVFVQRINFIIIHPQVICFNTRRNYLLQAYVDTYRHNNNNEKYINVFYPLFYWRLPSVFIRPINYVNDVIQ